MQTKRISSTFFSMAQTALQKQGLNLGNTPENQAGDVPTKARRRKRWQVRHPLRDLRFARGHTLEELAELTGLSPSYLSRLESGSRRLNADIMQKLAPILGCSPGDLLPFTPTSGPVPASAAAAPASPGMNTASFYNVYERRAQNQNLPVADLPVYAVRTLNHQLSIDFATPVEWVARTPEFLGVTGAFVLRLSDDQFAPRYTRNDQLLAHPARSLSTNCWVVVVTTDNIIHLGRFLHWRSQTQGGIGPVEANENDVITIQSHTQADEFTRKNIAGVYRIIGTMELA